MGTTERLVLDLPSHLVASLRESVRSGAYPSESAAIEELLVTWYGSEGTEEPPVELLRAFITEGVADADAGRMSDAEDVYKRVLGHIDTLAASKAK
jgi:Arc/MetJ-type ribon-helix-helix transcriptional regulator